MTKEQRIHYREGREAYLNGAAVDTCPHTFWKPEGNYWLTGWWSEYYKVSPSEHIESAEFTSAKCGSCEWSGFYNETVWTFPSDPPGPFCPKCGSICAVLEIV